MDASGFSSSNRPLGDMVRKLGSDATTLIRQELRLARTELKQTAREVARDAGLVAVGGGVAAVGGLLLVAFMVLLLGQLLGNRYWLSALLVGLLLAIGGGWLSYGSLARLRRRDLAPDEALASLRHTGGWARAEVRDLRRALTSRLTGRGNGRGAGRTLRAGHSPPRLGTPAHLAAPVPPPEGGLLKLLWHEFTDDDISGQAAKVAYYAFLSFPPALLVLFALTGFFGGPETAAWITMRLEAMLPAEASALIDGFVQQVVNDQAPGPFSVGLLLALWAASNVFMGLGDALNRVYDVEETRSWIKRRLLALAVMLVSALLFLGGSVLLVAGPGIAEALDLFGIANLLWTVLQWPLALLLVASAFWLIYYVLPARDQSDAKRSILKGATAAAILWALATIGFRIYVANFGSYSETYGFLGAVIVLLLWLYLTGVVVLLGGELNAVVEQRSRK